MNHRPSPAELDLEIAADRFARRVTARLTEGSADLPYDISERLRAARVQAMDKRKRPVAAPVRQVAPTQVVVGADGAAMLGGGWGGEGGNWWRAVVSAVPLLALVAGLVFISTSMTDNSEEVAEVDTALLTDDLPPSAYTDPGFVQYIKAGANTSR